MEFLVLGPLETREQGEPVRVRGMRQQRLLALLLLNAGRVVPVCLLVDELWEDPPPSARPQVHNAIRDLRRILATAGAETSLVTVDVGYCLVVPEDAVDAHRFTTRVRAARTAEREGRYTEAIRLLQSAVDLWRGDAFAGIECPAVTSAAVKLNEQRLTAIEDLMTLRLKAGEAGSLVGELQSLIAEYPLRDSLRGSLMIALCRSGRQAEALAVYDEGRRFLVDELGLEPSPRLRGLHAEILANSPNVHGPGEGTDPHVSPRRAVPTAGPADHPRNFLPHDLTDFTARSAELDTLLAAARPGQAGSPVMLAIDGMGGVGKTTLAVHLAHLVTRQYPDGQYFVNLRGVSATHPPVPTEQALAALLLASGLAPEEIPRSVDERSALWRSRLAGRRCLVVLDDAADTAAVTPLLPGAGGTLVLVTSRRKLTALDGALPLCLDVPPHEDAVALFARIVGEARAAREPARVAQAVELCGRLPLAVRIAATRLRDRPAWTVADLADRLASGSQRMRCLRTGDRDLMAVLAASYDHLDSAQRHFSRLICGHPASSHDIAQAAAVTGLPKGDVERHFDALIEHNLVREDFPDRFSFHALLRDCTRELAAGEAETALPAAV
ncbi:MULTISPECIES: BTAD domain-containing putative transcriptional regulator [unclassified Streptomyces]|uniref:AfsR/SARP family transcriptional regulator n=1 Tax=unclassified Streptomyces TaxID=2593676 RepID=UPI001F048D16|nr:MULTISPECIES: BTAD domain-containing putative transcriptional regulator [unclassified Streptomyces]MCH0566830.1 AAA family ATPase [Streptomyces sp. MUM 2J]MCH0570238.1 AAA family ATPase [Streptomyces sp. MUM 136J]